MIYGKVKRAINNNQNRPVKPTIEILIECDDRDVKKRPPLPPSI
jgi:hypothetical protein